MMLDRNKNFEVQQFYILKVLFFFEIYLVEFMIVHSGLEKTLSSISPSH